MKIIAYTYEADVHCVECARKAFAVGKLCQELERRAVKSGHERTLDENHILYGTEDCEGNRIHPIFSTDEQLEPLYCGTCRKQILELTYER